MDLHSNYLTPADNYLCFSLAEIRLASFDHRLAARGNLQFAEYVGHLLRTVYQVQKTPLLHLIRLGLIINKKGNITQYIPNAVYLCVCFRNNKSHYPSICR